MTDLCAAEDGAQRLTAGVVLIDKPRGVTSFAMVRQVRRLLGIRKVGHAGTLDPFATGLLIVCAGRPATRLIDRFMAGGKTYRALLQLGMETETLDPEGRVVRTTPVPALTEEEIMRCLARFTGRQLQAPPPFSAVKHQGKPLYHYARQGIMIAKEPRQIEISSLLFGGYDPLAHQLAVDVACSRGTYIRVLAADIGRSLGCGAHLLELRRLGSGCFTVAASLPGEALAGADGRQKLLAAMFPVTQAEAMLAAAAAVEEEEVAAMG
jgi:tRNA pseudouridine55 synthase